MNSEGTKALKMFSKHSGLQSMSKIKVSLATNGHGITIQSIIFYCYVYGYCTGKTAFFLIPHKFHLTTKGPEQWQLFGPFMSFAEENFSEGKCLLIPDLFIVRHPHVSLVPQFIYTFSQQHLIQRALNGKMWQRWIFCPLLLK